MSRGFREVGSSMMVPIVNSAVNISMMLPLVTGDVDSSMAVPPLNSGVNISMMVLHVLVLWRFLQLTAVL